MSDKNDKELNLNFDEYIRQGDPRKKKRLMLGVWLLANKPWMAEGIRLLAGTCPKKYRG